MRASKHADWIILLPICVFAGLIWRITNNIDLGDESYYAVFIDDWLKGSIASSTLSTLHQTAALLVYPASCLYVAFKGSNDGLLLFLRVLFVAGATATALVWSAYLRRLRGPICGWLMATVALAFIPFGLPAPSYNTLGMQGLLIGLGALGSLAARTGERWIWLPLSICGFCAAVVAYPTMIAAFCVLCALLLMFGRPTINVPRFYVPLAATAVIASWALVIYALSWRRLGESMSYLASINGTNDLSAKLASALSLVLTVRSFPCVLVAVAAISLSKHILPVYMTALMTAVALVSVEISGAALFIHSHDAMSLAAVSGIGLMFGLRRRASSEERIFAIIMGTSLAAGAVSLLTATNSVFNFCIGAAPAAILALAAPRPVTLLDRCSIAASQAALLVVVSISSFTVFYGDDPADFSHRQRIQKGVFSGLAVQAGQADMIRFVRQVDDLTLPDRTIALFGRGPGLIMATHARPLALTVFPLLQTVSAEGLAATRAFYDDPIHRPKIVIIYIDLYLVPVNPMTDHFSEWYELCGEYKGGQNVLKVYQRRI